MFGQALDRIVCRADHAVSTKTARSILRRSARCSSSTRTTRARRSLIMGSTGETRWLVARGEEGDHRRDRQMKTGKMPIFYGCTGNNTETTIAMVRFAKDNGADGAIPGGAGLHLARPRTTSSGSFSNVADATDLPLGIYNNPPRVKSDLHWDHLIRIFKHPNYGHSQRVDRTRRPGRAGARGQYESLGDVLRLTEPRPRGADHVRSAATARRT